MIKKILFNWQNTTSACRGDECQPVAKRRLNKLFRRNTAAPLARGSLLVFAAIYLFFSLRAAVLYFVEYEDCTQFSDIPTPGVVGGPSEAVICRDMNEVRLRRILVPFTPAPMYL